MNRENPGVTPNTPTLLQEDTPPHPTPPPTSHTTLTAGTKRMALKVTSPSAVKWIFANGSVESLENSL